MPEKDYEPIAEEAKPVIQPPSPFSPNEERQAFADDPEAYAKKQAEAKTVTVISDEERATLEGPGTRSDALPGIQAGKVGSELRVDEANQSIDQQKQAQDEQKRKSLKVDEEKKKAEEAKQSET